MLIEVMRMWKPVAPRTTPHESSVARKLSKTSSRHSNAASEDRELSNLVSITEESSSLTHHDDVTEALRADEEEKCCSDGEHSDDDVPVSPANDDDSLKSNMGSQQSLLKSQRSPDPAQSPTL